MADHLKAIVATSTAPFRVILNHMNILSRTKPKFDKVRVLNVYLPLRKGYELSFLRLSVFPDE